MMAEQNAILNTVYCTTWKFPQKGGRRLKRRRFLSLEACGLLDHGCWRGPSDDGQRAGGGAAACPAPSGRLRCAAECPERLAGESAQLKYPMQGDLLSPFLFCRVWTATASRTPRSLHHRPELQRLHRHPAEGCRRRWQVPPRRIEGLADTVDNVRPCAHAGRHAMPAGGGLSGRAGRPAIWRCTPTRDGTVKPFWNSRTSSIWWRISPAAAIEDLILMSTLEDGGVQIELLTVDRGRLFQQVAVMGLSADRFSGCASVAAGAGCGRQALSGAGRLDRHFRQQSGHGAAVLRRGQPADGARQQISTSGSITRPCATCPRWSAGTWTATASVEIPTQPDEGGSAEHEPEPTEWTSSSGWTTPARSRKELGLLDEETNCYIELPAEWEGNLTAHRQRGGRGSGGAAHRGRG